MRDDQSSKDLTPKPNWLNRWGFTLEGWKTGQRGEYLVLLQGLLLLGFILLPVVPVAGVTSSGFWQIVTAIVAAGLGLMAVVLVAKGLIDLGQNLTPLPYPKLEETWCKLESMELCVIRFIAG